MKNQTLGVALFIIIGLIVVGYAGKELISFTKTEVDNTKSSRPTFSITGNATPDQAAERITITV